MITLFESSVGHSLSKIHKKACPDICLGFRTWSVDTSGRTKPTSPTDLVGFTFFLHFGRAREGKEGATTGHGVSTLGPAIVSFRILSVFTFRSGKRRWDAATGPRVSTLGPTDLVGFRIFFHFGPGARRRRVRDLELRHLNSAAAAHAAFVAAHELLVRLSRFTTPGYTWDFRIV